MSDLVVELTGSRARQIPHGGAVCVHGESLQALLCGRGSILFRYPTVDHQEEQLRSKVNSKMTVATFLAGFVFTALSALLLLQGADWTWHRVVAAAALTAALVLFVSAVYIYDQLSTPPGFWTDGNKSRYFWRKAEHDTRLVIAERRPGESPFAVRPFPVPG